MAITTIGQYADLMILDLVAADRSLIGMYSLATIFFFAASALAGAVQGVATPHFTGLIRNRAGFRSSLLRWSLWLIAGGIVVAIGAIVFAWLLEAFFLGQAYSSLSLMVALLMLRFCIWCSYAVGGAAMVGIGAIRQGTAIAFLTTAFAIAAGYPLVLWYGVWGAGVAQVLVAVLSAVLVFRVVAREASKIAISD
jgi:O-antigen/teichoic acid export membrane protein